MYTFYTFPAEDCKAPCKQQNTYPQIYKAQKLRDLSPQASFTKLGLCPQRMGLPPRAEVGKKQAFSFSLTHAHSPPMLLRNFTAVNVCTITASMPLPNVCLLSSSCLPGKDPTGFGWKLLQQCKGSSASSGWFTVGPKLDPQHALKGQPITCAGCLSQAAQLNLREKGVLLAKTCFFFLWRDWKDMLLLSYTKR